MISIIINALIITFIIQAIWFSMLDGEIFGGIGDFFDHKVSDVLHNPLFKCPICMTPWYGALISIFIIQIDPFNLRELAATILTAMGMQVVITPIVSFFRESNSGDDKPHDYGW